LGYFPLSFVHMDLRKKLAAGLLAAGMVIGIIGLNLTPGPLRSARVKSAPDPIPPPNVAADKASESARARTATLAAPKTPSLPPPRQRLWERPIPEEPFARFAEWTRRYTAAPPDQKAALAADGIALARARRTALADLIQSNPERALELALPHAVRGALPESVRALMEQPVNAVADYEVLCFLPMPGREADIVPTLRYATIDGERHQVFTFGAALQYVTRAQVPVNGVAVPREAATVPPPDNDQPAASLLLALSPNPVRLLDQSEVDELRAARPAEPICSVSGQSVSSRGEETAVQLGGHITSFCDPVHAEDWAAAQIAALDLETPAAPASLLTAESSDTEGRKRMLLMRPIWVDYSGGMSTNQALTHWVNFSNYMYEMSYGQLVLAALRAGSDITPPMLLPGLVAEYDNTGLGKLYNTCKEVARTNYGYNLSQYDYLYVCTAGEPAASYAGLGFVGGVGFHLANSSWGASTSSHEFGHNLGLNHAHFWDTSLQSIIGSGQNVEYGDNNDPMGGGGSPNQYNSRYKNYLGWIRNTDVADLDALGSGTYRLYCLDLNDSVGLRGLKFRRSASQNYWVQFRQRKTAKPALLNGVQMLWTGNGNQGSYLLDVRLKGDADNNAVVIGRTFSDPSVGLHVTPIGLGHTYPESIDVVVRTGPQPGNLPPTVALSASALNAGLGQPITFTATASDPNGDPLAYYWEFGDDAESYSIDNSPAQTHSFAAAGEYAVRCVASDMRGGTAQHTLVVRVGNPASFRISGHVVDAQNRPLAGILVRAGTRAAYTDSDGGYAIVGLGAGSYTLTAIEPVAGSLSFAHPFFNNPVVVGPNFTSADFVGVPGSLNIYTPLVAKAASNWRYLDTGADQGTAWRAPSFNDASWRSGTAPLGYPAGAPINTVISYGANPNNKYTTSYFRRQFSVADPATFTNLLLEVLRDDGVVVYLNGVEVFRDNLPAGAIAYATAALDTVDADTYLQTNLPVSVLVTGPNTLAAEVHQSTANSSDVALDVALSGLSVSNAVGFHLVYLSAPADHANFTSPTNVTLSAAVRTAATVSLVEFFADGVKIGDDSGAPYDLVWSNPAEGPHALRAVARIGSLQITSPPVRITLGPPVSQPVARPLVQTGSVWRYLAQATAAPSGWAQRTFNDSGWLSGAAELGFGDSADGRPETTVINGGPSSSRYPTIYFRRAFTVADPDVITDLAVLLKRDDGAIVYLNGIELLRDNLPGGVVTYGTLASTADDDGATFHGFNVPPGGLVPGTNVLAVEVHQSALTSSDLSFDLGLYGSGSSDRPRGCWLVAPAEGATVPLPGSAALGAQMVAGGTLGVAKVEFFADGLKLGEDTTFPFSFIWPNPPGGAHTLTAVGTDTAGGSVSSAPVNILVTAPPVGTALVSLGDVWKYLDDGSNQGAAWVNPGFDDRTWMAGAARFGYGGNGEITTIRYGLNVNERFITAYFRKVFAVADPSRFNGLLLRLVRDDGAVVYLNGVEVYRTNLQPGPVSWNSLALDGIDPPNESIPVETRLDSGALVTGNNVLAVELHQSSYASDDASFDLALTGLQATNVTEGIYLASPAAGTHFNAPASVSLSAYVTAPAPVSLVEYYGHDTKIGESSVHPYNFSWNTAPVGHHTLMARATYGAGLTMTSPPVSIMVGPPPPPIQPVVEILLAAGSTWKYWDNATAVPSGWQTAGFNDGAWPSARARFGFGLDGEATPLTAGRVTWYFRRWVNVNNPAVLGELACQLVRDDGAVVYLNGAEIFRSNMPSGPVTASTLAASTAETPDETTFFETALATAGSGLLTGSNLVAVELHQAAANSSDAGFDLQLVAFGTTEPRVYLSSPANNSIFSTSSTVLLEALAWAGAGGTVSKVEFFVDGAKLGESSTAPYRLSWTGPFPGAHALTARLTDTAGGVLESAPVTVLVPRSLVTTTLTPANSSWKYLDTGVAPSASWVQPNFNDSAWRSGPARLGFGADGEATVVNGGPAGARYPTIYFRRAFVVPGDVFYTNLTFRLLRDDGAVVYLNGVEVFRDNMPAGPISFGTLAPDAVSGADEQTFFVTTAPATHLAPGTNVIAVEVHQNAVNSSDLGFNLELTAGGFTEDTTVPALSISTDGAVLELSWPATAVGWRLYTATRLGAPASEWAAVPDTPVVVENRKFVALMPTNGMQFFRLGKP
jgi:hypothetical protein